MRLNIRLDLTSQQVRDRVLEGLDSWVKLGLLSDAQVRELAQVMSKPLPRAPEAPVEPARNPYYPLPRRNPIAAAFSPDPVVASEWADPQTRSQADAQTSDTSAASASRDVSRGASRDTQRARSSGMPTVLRSLLDEISVIWLLFLGVFLVVISSGVLAATQWQSFSAVGQYAILFGYTMAFWGAGLWTRGQERLQATSRMLVLTTLLLIPVNFWMMDALGVLNTGFGKGAGVLAAIALSYLPFGLLDRSSNRLNLIGLGWLHWGWVASSFLGLVGDWSLWPVAATYLGTVGTAVNLTSQDRGLAVLTDAAAADVLQAETSDIGTLDIETSEAEISNAEASHKLSFDLLAVGLAVLILLFRSLFIEQVPPHQLGLAAGICGWLLAWLNRNKPNREIWQVAGYGLLLLGWAVSVTQQPPWQAIGVSLLGLWLLWDQLKRHWKTETVLALIGVAGQAYWLLGAAIPKGTRETILTQLSSQLSADPILKSEWTSLGFFPFLLGLLWFARQLRRWQKYQLSQTTEASALVLGGGLSLLSLSNPFTASANLLLSAVLLFGVVCRRQRIAEAMVSVTHITGLLALAAGIDYVRPGLSSTVWGYIGLGVGVAEFAVHLLSPSDRWRRSTWAGGLGVFALSYLPLIDSWRDHPYWVWLMVPVTLSCVVNHRRALAPQWLARAAVVALVLHTPWLGSWQMASVSFAVGTVCLLVNSRVWRTQLSALLAVGSGVVLAGCVAYQWLVTPWQQLHALPPGTPSGEARLFVVWAIVIWALWLMARGLARRPGTLATLYERATQVWGGVLMVILLLLGSFVALFALSGEQRVVSDQLATHYLLAATVLVIAALLESIRHRPAEWRYWSLAWASGIVMVLGLSLREALPAEIAIAFLALGFITQVLGDVWVLKRPPYRASWHGIPLIYGGIGLMLGHHGFSETSSSYWLGSSVGLQVDTGLYTVFAAVIAMGVGRRKLLLRPLSYVGLVALSVGAYELVIYQLMQASGGQPGDGITILAGVALAIALVQKLLRPWLIRYGHLSRAGLSLVSHGHWALGSVGALWASLDGLSEPKGIVIWTAISLLLAGYALVIGNRRWTPQPFVGSHTAWTAIGLLEALLCITYDRFEWFDNRDVLFSWGGVIACGIGWVLYAAPWEKWGWPARPWQSLGLWLPMLTLSITLEHVTTQGLLIVGAFYAGMAKQFNQVRISYLTVFLFDWALLRYLDGQGLLTELWVSLLLGLSALYVIQLEPWLRETSRRQQRHWLRTLSIGMIGLTALYQADVSEPMLAYAALTLVLAIAAVFAGLIFKIRAFLYVGTATFILQIVRVLWLYIGEHSSLLWAVGIALGLLFIWVAATFESRRSQVINLLESWSAALQTWD